MHSSKTLECTILGVPMKFDVATMLTTVVSCLLVFLIVFFAARRPSLVPTGSQNVLESIFDFIQDMVKSQIDAKTAHRFYGFMLSLFLYIFIANQIGLITSVVSEETQHVWWKSPTANINVALSMAFAITLGAHILGMRKHKLRYFRQYINPLEIFAVITQPLTHGMRLWANIFAGEIMIAVLMQGDFMSHLMVSMPLVVWLGYSVFVGAIQAYVFSVLAMVYIGQQLSDSH